MLMEYFLLILMFTPIVLFLLIYALAGLYVMTILPLQIMFRKD